MGDSSVCTYVELHDAVMQGKKAPIVTSKDVFPEYYMIYAEKFQDVINDDIDEWVYFFKHGKIRDEKALEVAKEMLLDKESIEKIQKWTKLSLETIQELARELGLGGNV